MFRAMFGFEGTNLHKKKVILDSSMVEHSAVNRVVVGSSPTRGVCFIYKPQERQYGSMVKRLRHRPFTAVTRVRFPLESLLRGKENRISATSSFGRAPDS